MKLLRPTLATVLSCLILKIMSRYCFRAVLLISVAFVNICSNNDQKQERGSNKNFSSMLLCDQEWKVKTKQSIERFSSSGLELPNILQK